MSFNFGLQKKERVKNKKDFENIYKFGTTVFSSDNKLKSIYVCNYKSDQPGVKIAAAVHKKSGSAVWRNRVKRLIKESYRLQKKALVEKCIRNNLLVKLIISPNAINQSNYRTLALTDVNDSVLNILNKISQSL